MINGRGLVSSGLIDRDGVVYHADGVANSRCVDRSQFAKDKERLKRALDEPGIFVYFGTCSTDDTPYVAHKLDMEQLVRERGSYLICNIPIVVGVSENPFTLMNHLRDKITKGEPVEVWTQARRNVVDVRDVGQAVDWLVERWEGPQKALVAAPWDYSMAEIVHAMERGLRKVAHKVPVDKGAGPRVIGDIPIHWSGIESIVRRYYS